jgi:tyrocidine synthetase-3
VIKTGEQQHTLVIDKHHIVNDGLSNQILIMELEDLYRKKELPPLRLQYKDYAEWLNCPQQQEAMEKQKSYWLRQFQDDVPVLNLPTDYPRPPFQVFAGNTLTFEVDEDETEALRKLLAKEETTLFVLLLSLFYVLLSKLSSHEDIVVGTPVFGRRHADFQNIIGMFVNTLALRNVAEGEKRFSAFIQEVKANTLNALENQDYPFEKLVEQVDVTRDVSRNPLFDVMFVIMEVELPESKLAGVPMSSYIHRNKISKFDLTLEAVEQADKLRFTFEYNTSLFKPGTIKRFICYFEKIILSVLEDPERKISGIEIITEEEKTRILYEFNETTVEYLKNKTIHHLFEEQVGRTPDSIAVMGTAPSAPGQLTYGELNQKSNQLAHLLHEKGVRPDTIVAIMVERSLEMLVGIFAILKAGGAYLPIDPIYPGERMNYMLADSRAKILVTTRLLAEESNKVRMGTWEGETIWITKEDTESTEREQLPTHPLTPSPTHLNLAYVIYTSGSTGKPKGVMIKHQAVHNFIKGITEQIDFVPGKTILALTTISFDIFVLETLLPLSQGLRIVIADERHQIELHLLEELIIESNPDMLQATPTRMQMFTESGRRVSCLYNMKEIMIGGEPFPGKLLKDLKQLTSARIYNMYGPTETTVWSTVRDLSTGASEEINIGQPIANTQISILDKNNNIQPMGLIGELYIGGDGLASGYLNRPELTSENFVYSKFQITINKSFCGGPWLQGGSFYKKGVAPPTHSRSARCRSFGGVISKVCRKNKVSQGISKKSPLAAGGKIYRTGDLARWLPDGNIELSGRIDHQVKIRGFRIELGEIETQLLSHPQVKETVVVAKENQRGDKYLCAYFVSDKKLEGIALKDSLSTKLPDYMIPSHFVRVDSIPLTPNGKIDRKTLPEPEIIAAEEYAAPGNVIEEKLVEIWEEVLGRNKIGVNDDFFRIGGDSIKAIQIAARMNLLGYKLEMRDIFRYSSISQLSPFVKKEEPKADQNQSKLNPIISYSSAREKRKRELTPSDLTHPQLSIENLEQIKKQYPYPIEDIYPCTPMQEGMLFHALYDHTTSANYLQETTRLRGEIDISVFKRSLNELLNRHPILRTVFVYEGLDRPMQVVFKEWQLDFSYVDIHQWGDTSDTEKERFIKEFREKDQDRSFDLSRDALARFAVIQIDNVTYETILSAHHILLDAWCMGILNLEFIEIYDSLLQNRPYHLPPVTPYRTYIQWLEKRDKQKTMEYWRNLLKGYNEPVGIPMKKTLTESDEEYLREEFSFILTVEKTEALKELAAKEKVTLSVVFQTIWAILLGKYNGKRDVVFGLVVSGRPTEIKGIESMVGLFINSIPLRIGFRNSTKFCDLLQQVQATVVESEPHHYCSLADIQSQTSLKQNLFNHLLTFLNRIIGGSFENGRSHRGKSVKTEPAAEVLYTKTLVRSSYNFDLVIDLTDQVTILIRYNSKLYDSNFMRRLESHIQEVLDQVIENSDIHMEDITLSHDRVVVNSTIPMEDNSDFEL